MKILFDRKLQEKDDFKLPLEDRAFRYGDGLFETVLVKNSEVKLLDLHIDRLLKGLKFLQINTSGLTEESIREDIHKLLDDNGIKNCARVRLTVWRKEGGLYTPSESGYHILISVHLLKNDYSLKGIIENVGLSEKVKNHHFELSGFKSLSSVHYVLAGLEKKNKEWDDIIILSDEGYISEGLHSNIFFLKNTFFLTPSLNTGCIEGVMRQKLLNYLSTQDVRTGEVLFTVQDMMEAEQIFICNAMGIRFLKNVNNKEFNTSVPEVLDAFIKSY
ncbi:MAG: aminotransferase class IV [Bacteroidota bacterium]